MEPPTTFSSDLLTGARLEAEASMQARVIERFGLARAVAAVPEAARLEEQRALHAQRAQFVHVTPRTTPRLYRLAQETLERIGLPTAVELLIDPSEAINAGAFPLALGETAPILAISSGAVRRLDDAQLRCVLAHELGHIAYGHTELRRMVRLVYREVEAPELLTARLRVLARLQELSCDRAGALAVDRDLLVAAETEFLVATGLGSEHVELDLAAYAEEVARIEAFDVPQHLFELSHPLLPIRLRALQLFCEGADETEVLRLVRLMDYEAASPEMRHQRNLLLAGGLLAAHADGDAELDDAERAHLVELVVPFSDDPEGELAALGTFDEARALLENSAAWLQANAGPERFELVAQLVELTLVDGKVGEGEAAFLLEVGERLDVPPAWIRERLRQHQEATSRAPGAPRDFGLRPPKG